MMYSLGDVLHTGYKVSFNFTTRLFHIQFKYPIQECGSSLHCQQSLKIQLYKSHILETCFKPDIVEKDIKLLQEF